MLREGVLPVNTRNPDHDVSPGYIFNGSFIIFILAEHCKDGCMYSSDLDLYTKARLRDTQDVARSQRPTPTLTRWVRRAARRLGRR